jgi:pilus assembly protein CpaC
MTRATLSRATLSRALRNGLLLIAFGLQAGETVPVSQRSAETANVTESLTVFVGKSLLLESKIEIERISVGYGDIAEASAVGPREVLLNGKAPGVTSLIIWQRSGSKLFFDVTVRANSSGTASKVEAVRAELGHELPSQDVELSYENETVFLRGRVKDLVSSERAVSIASTLGKTVNLLYVDVPPPEAQILLKVRFATIDRSASLQLGLNLVSTGAGNTIGGVSTQQFSGPSITSTPGATAGAPSTVTATLSDALNLFLFRPDLNLLATIQALQQTSVLEILAEPNLLAMNGKPASFLAGGEFPFPTFQAAANGVGSVSISFREFGVRLNFTPIITPRGTIRLLVAPEVSALDFTSGLVVQGFTVPALTVRKMNTEIELASGQSFALGGLINNQFTETISKIPFISEVPVLGKLFQSKSRTKNNTELLVIVTPELVTPIPAGQPLPEMKYPKSPMWPSTVPTSANPSGESQPSRETIPVETLIKSMQPVNPGASPAPATQQPGAASAPPPTLSSK